MHPLYPSLFSARELPAGRDPRCPTSARLWQVWGLPVPSLENRETWGTRPILVFLQYGTPTWEKTVILPPTKGRRENLTMPLAPPASAALAFPIDPPLAFGSRRMTAWKTKLSGCPHKARPGKPRAPHPSRFCSGGLLHREAHARRVLQAGARGARNGDVVAARGCAV